jgi:hypothetical protein
MPETPDELPVEPTSKIDEPVPPTPEPMKKKTTDRPHWITICLGLLSPMLAVLALYMSVQSLKTSRDSLEIGQRAYIHGEIVATQDKSFPKSNGYNEWVLTFTLKNQGSTPGIVTHQKIMGIDMSDKCSGDVATIYYRVEVNNYFTQPQHNHHDSLAMIIQEAEYEKDKAKLVDACDLSGFPDSSPKSSLSIAGKDSAANYFWGVRMPDDFYGRPYEYPTINADFTYEDIFHRVHHGHTFCTVLSGVDKLQPSCVSDADKDEPR